MQRLAPSKSQSNDQDVSHLPPPHLAGEVLHGVRWEAGPRGLHAGGWVKAPHRAVGRGSITELDTLGVAKGGHGRVEGFIGGSWDSGTEVPAPQGVWGKGAESEARRSGLSPLPLEAPSTEGPL